jgi:uncharacterized protein YdeI (YjbR/CyaY-like superfamily)
MASREKYLPIESGKAWRDWLAANHSVKTEAWLIIQKKKSSASGLRLAEAVEEALCFGWIDGTMHRLNSGAFALRFSPRRPGAVWSAANRRRVQRLIGEGRMTEAGLAAVRRAKRSGEWRAAFSRKKATRLPADFAKALADPKTGRWFSRLAPSKKEQFLWWIASAKKPETRSKRIRALIRMATGKERRNGCGRQSLERRDKA